MLAHAFPVVAALAEHTQRPAAPGYVLLTCNEVQHLFAALVIPASSFDGAVLAGWERLISKTPCRTSPSAQETTTGKQVKRS